MEARILTQELGGAQFSGWQKKNERTRRGSRNKFAVLPNKRKGRLILN